MLDLNQIRAFVAVVDTGGFSRAARAVGTTQPVISQLVRKLEADIGARLLVRGHARTVSTDDGARFLPHARALLRAEARARASIAKEALTIAASTNIGAYLLPPMLAAYTRRATGPTVDLVIGTNLETVDRLESGVADIALMEWWDGRPGFASHVWRTEPLVVIVNPSHPWAVRRQIEKADLFGEPIIGGEPGTGTGQLLRRVYGPSASRLETVLTVGSTAAVKEAVKAGLGISIVMAASAGEEVRNGTLCALEIADGVLSKDLYSVTPVDQPATSPAAIFNRFVAETLAPAGL